MSTNTDTGNPFPNMPDISFSVKELYNLQINKASGSDCISPYTLKNCAEEISPVLKVIFTESFKTGNLPTDWLTANVCPMPQFTEKENVMLPVIIYLSL